MQRTPLAELGLANTPITLRTQLAPSSEGGPVEKRGAFTTPWRTVQVADSAAGLYESNLILNPANRRSTT